MLSLGEIASAAETWWRAGTGHLHKAGAHVRPILVSPDNSVVYFTVNVKVLCRSCVKGRSTQIFNNTLLHFNVRCWERDFLLNIITNLYRTNWIDPPDIFQFFQTFFRWKCLFASWYQTAQDEDGWRRSWGNRPLLAAPLAALHLLSPRKLLNNSYPSLYLATAMVVSS